MRTRTACLIGCSFIWALLPSGGTATEDPAPLRLVQTIDLPGVEGRIDHLAVDVRRQRLYVAALGNNTLEVLDLRAGKHLHRVTGLHEPQGIAVVEDGRVVVANRKNGHVDIFDGESLRLTRSVALGEDADNVRYDAAARRLYVGYGSGAIASLDLEGNAVATTKLAGHPESFQIDPRAPRLLINVPSAGHIAVADLRSSAVSSTWPVTSARANYPMALDADHQRAFVGCRRPARLLVYDTSSGKEITGLDIDGDTDDLFYDRERRRLYVACGDGFIDVVEQTDADHYRSRARIETAAGARTALWVVQLSRLYLAVPHRGAQAAEIRVYEAPSR
jgi:hypothetical protein